MTEQIEGDISILELLTRLIEHWRLIAIGAVIGGGIAAASVAGRPPLFRAYASFAAQSSEQGMAGLASLAGQLGINVPSTGQQASSPEYYAALATSRSLLLAVSQDSFPAPGRPGTKEPLPLVLGFTGPPSPLRTEQTLSILHGMIGTSVSRQTGIVEVSAATRWPDVSLAIVEALVRDVNLFNQESRRTQATAERQFVEGRLALADSALRKAEDDLQALQRSNRQFDAASEVSLERSRLEAELERRRQVASALDQAYEEVRLREVRDTPLITMVEPPTVPAVPEPRGRLKVALMGLVVGAFLGCLIALSAESIKRRRAARDPKMIEFLAAVSGFYADLTAPARRLFGRRS